jgi:hypothetical protein
MRENRGNFGLFLANFQPPHIERKPLREKGLERQIPAIQLSYSHRTRFSLRRNDLLSAAAIQAASRPKPGSAEA